MKKLYTKQEVEVLLEKQRNLCSNVNTYLGNFTRTLDLAYYQRQIINKARLKF